MDTSTRPSHRIVEPWLQPRSRVLVGLSAGLALGSAVGCGSCQGTSASDPRQHLPADARAVIEVSDLARLPELWSTLETRFSKVVPAEDLVKLRSELQRSLGFDPFTPEGLEAAGLRTSGPVVGHATDQSSLWVLPVADRKLLEGTVTQLVAARAFADKETGRIGGATGVLYTRAFGADKATVAALVTRSGTGFLGIGPESKELVAAAIAQKPETALPTSKDYLALIAQLEGEGLVRVSLPRTSETLKSTLKTARSRIPVAFDEETADGVKGAAWQVDLTSSGLGIQGRVRLEGRALVEAKSLFDTKLALPESLRQLDLPGAVVYLLLNGQADALLARIAPENSRSRTRLRRLVASLGLNEKEVLEALTGQLALSAGLGDLSKASLQQLVRAPQYYAWVATGVGVKEGSQVGAITEDMKKKLGERDFEVTELKIGSQTVSRVVSEEDPEFVLVDTYVAPGAIVYATEPAVTEGLLGLAPGRDPLQGKPGVVFELRLRALAERLATFDVNRLPLMFRSFANQGLEALAVFDRLRLVLEPAAGGFEVNGSLDLAPEPGTGSP